MKLKQCHLQRGTQHTTGWIPTRGARVGASVELLPSRERWNVVEVFAHELSSEGLKEIQLLNRNSLPSVEGMR